DVLVKTREWENAKDMVEYYKDQGLILADKDVEQRAKRDLMKSLYLCLHVINALEAIRFYVSFA
ncbi:hypothetical protein ACLI1Z_14835, partial [Enterococcus faecalis]